MSAPRLFDHALRDARRRRALRSPVAGANFLLERVADDLAERLSAVSRTFSRAADLGSPGPELAAALTATGKVEGIVRFDAMFDTRPDLVADLELLPLAPGSIDLAVSALAFQWVDDLPGLLAQIRRALKPDGLLLAAFLGGDTLTELRESFAAAEAELTGGASPRVAPFAELRAAGALLQRAGFALPVIDQERHTVRYANALDLMRDLRAMGATNPLRERSRKPMTKALLFRTAAIYADRFADADGRIRATFDVISLSGWVPHESQQKPLRPGSATTRLADALNATERSLGEKAGR